MTAPSGSASPATPRWGSGILASSLGVDLARRGHDVHFISYERPFRLPPDSPLRYHPVRINAYGLFKYPRLHPAPLRENGRSEPSPSTRRVARPLRGAARDRRHPRAIDLPPELRLKVVATLHRTDTTLLGRDPGYGPAIRHALECSDAVTVVSEYLRDETRRLLGFRPADRFGAQLLRAAPPPRTRDEVRQELGVMDEAVVLHTRTLRPVKRVDLLLRGRRGCAPRANRFRLVILAGEGFAPFADDVRRLGLEGQVMVLERVPDIEEYLQAADLGLFASDSESFCLSILEAMCFGCPSVATRVGGIPEVVEDGISGLPLVPPGDAAGLARAVGALSAGPAPPRAMGAAAGRSAGPLVLSARPIAPGSSVGCPRVAAGRERSAAIPPRGGRGGAPGGRRRAAPARRRGRPPDPVGRRTADEAGSPSRCAASRRVPAGGTAASHRTSPDHGGRSGPWAGRRFRRPG